MPKVSIILPCYNVEKYLSKSIHSVLGQTYRDFELLVIIDGSPDNSQQIAEQIAHSDSRIQVFEKKNGGLSDARNYGLERAQGEFVYFMDSDDWIEPTLLEENLKTIEDENLDFIVFGYVQDNENTNGDIVNSLKIVPKAKAWVKGEQKITIDDYHLGLLGYAWNKVYRKSFLDLHQFRFQKGISLVEDILFNAPVYTQSNLIRFNQKAYYHYINRPVETLIKQFHFNSFDLKIKKTKALKVFFDIWQVDTKLKNEILGFAVVQGIRYCVHNMFSFKNKLTFNDKANYIKTMLHDDMTIQLVRYYKPVSKIDLIYKFLIKHKSYRAIAILAFLKK